MVSWKKLLTYSAVSLSALCLSNHSSIKYYDSPGGLNERYLNTHFPERFKDKKNLEYLANTDRVEKKHYFEKLNALEGTNEIMFTLIAENDNELLIYKVANAKRETLSEGELKLKDLLDELDKLNEKTPDKGKLLGLLHNRINQSLSVGNPWSPYVGIISMLNGGEGDCNDVSAVHSSLYAHYRFEVKVKYGRAHADGTDKTALHAWLEVKMPNGTIDLDPTWYKEFAPLESR